MRLNLNVYRNEHFQALNKAKIAFADIVKPLLAHLPVMQQVNLTYVHFPGTNHLIDTPNVCVVVDKFFSDALVSNGKINDDNYTIVKDVLYRHGAVDADNPRVEVTIEPIGEYEFPVEQEEESMQITLVQAEIEQAITNYINDQVNIKEGMKIVIDLSATRGADGFKATIDIVTDDAPSAVVTTVAVVKEAPVKQARTVTASKEEVKADPKPTGSAQSAKAQEPAPAEAVAEPETPVEEEPEVLDQDEDLTADPEQEVEPEEEEEETPPPAKPATSLFAGLQRPKNN